MADLTSTVLASVERLQLVNYVAVATLSLLIYDYCLTLGDEVHLIWGSKLNIMKILYFLSRYPTFVDVALTVYADVNPHMPVNQCLPVNNGLSWLTTLGIGIAELILILRTFALWARNKKVLYGLLAVFTAFFVPSLVITGIFLNTITVLPPPYPSYPGCNLASGSSIIFANFIMLILFETIIVVMTVYRGYKKFRGSPSPLVATLYKDGILFFVCLFCISLANVLNLSLGPFEYQNLITTFQRVMHSLLSCRIVLHARRIDRPLLGATPLAPILFAKLSYPQSPNISSTRITAHEISVDAGNGGTLDTV